MASIRNSKRAQRRSDHNRMKQKARKLRPWDTQAHTANHLASCSCPMCGNPRKWFRSLTQAELKSLAHFKSALKDI